METLLIFFTGILAGYLLSRQGINIKFTHRHEYDHPEMVHVSDEEAEQEVKEQDVLASAQNYLDRYLREED